MNREARRPSTRCFAIELTSRNNLGDLMVHDGSGRVAIDGSIGTIRHARFIEESVLEVEGSGGTLRLDLSKEDLAREDERYQ